MPALTVLIFSLVGLAFGSFANVLLLRLFNGESILGRSRCPHCRHPIAWYDLMPLFSFAILGGRCRHCRKRISLQYLLIESVTAILFALAAYVSLPSIPLAIASSVVLYGLLLVCVFDYKYEQIPDIFTLIVLIGALMSAALQHSVASSVGGGLIVFAWFSLQWLISLGKFIGAGDIFLGAALGLWLGQIGAITMLFASYIIGATVGSYLLITKRITRKDARLPFAPFLAAGALLAFVGVGEIYWKYVL